MTLSVATLCNGRSRKAANHLKWSWLRLVLEHLSSSSTRLLHLLAVLVLVWHSEGFLFLQQASIKYLTMAVVFYPMTEFLLTHCCYWLPFKKQKSPFLTLSSQQSFQNEIQSLPNLCQQLGMFISEFQKKTSMINFFPWLIKGRLNTYSVPDCK